ncbi:hypothetical protein EES43_28950 [Streptomyces sp. ADI96-02]|nr:hypothetical protein EES43_28950 [Streptomyces sp. ADI96-02]
MSAVVGGAFRRPDRGGGGLLYIVRRIAGLANRRSRVMVPASCGPMISVNGCWGGRRWPPESPAHRRRVGLLLATRLPLARAGLVGGSLGETRQQRTRNVRGRGDGPGGTVRTGTGSDGPGGCVLGVLRGQWVKLNPCVPVGGRPADPVPVQGVLPSGLRERLSGCGDHLLVHRGANGRVPAVTLGEVDQEILQHRGVGGGRVRPDSALCQRPRPPDQPGLEQAPPQPGRRSRAEVKCGRRRPGCSAAHHLANRELRPMERGSAATRAGSVRGRLIRRAERPNRGRPRRSEP